MIRGSALVGILLIVLGALFLLDKADVLDVGDTIAQWWPVILIAAGLLYLGVSPRHVLVPGVLIIAGLALLAGSLGFRRRERNEVHLAGRSRTGRSVGDLRFESRWRLGGGSCEFAGGVLRSRYGEQLAAVQRRSDPDRVRGDRSRPSERAAGRWWRCGRRGVRVWRCRVPRARRLAGGDHRVPAVRPLVGQDEARTPRCRCSCPVDRGLEVKHGKN